jgi:hypothetical protein
MSSWHAENNVIIQADIEKIFRTLRDYNKFGKLFGLGYQPYGYWTRIIGDEQLAKEGSIVSHRLLTLYFKRRVEIIEANTRIVERYIGPNYEGLGVWKLEQLPKGVRVTYIYDAADTGWQSKLIYALSGTRSHHYFYSSGLNRLKRKLESEIEP